MGYQAENIMRAVNTHSRNSFFIFARGVEVYRATKGIVTLQPARITG